MNQGDKKTYIDAVIYGELKKIEINDLVDYNYGKMSSMIKYSPYWHFQSQQGYVVPKTSRMEVLIMLYNSIHVDFNNRQSTRHFSIRIGVMCAQAHFLKIANIINTNMDTVACGQDEPVVYQGAPTVGFHLFSFIVQIQKHCHPGELVETCLPAFRSFTSISAGCVW